MHGGVVLLSSIDAMNFRPISFYHPAWICCFYVLMCQMNQFYFEVKSSVQ
jgi:hypothetical protein